ncbi:MAG: tRNA epoxyqueuosine(34) reductase QueG [Pseudomonadales bacterium]
MTEELQQLAQNIRVWAQGLGFQALGITDTDLSSYRDRVRAWLDAGHHGEMGYMTRNLDKRLHPAQLEPETCRVISARMNCLPEGTQPLEVLDAPGKAYVARYALGRDYHKTLRRRLARLAARIDAAARELTPELAGRYRAFTDSAPVLEKALAEKAGLGWIGKHTLLLNRQVGSWFLLGEIYTNLPLPVDAPETSDHCGSCRACMTVCPTGAIVAPRQLDARRCISYLTIEHKGAIPPALRPLLGNRVFGCDDCQLYCPWNRQPAYSTEPDFSPRHALDAPELLALFAWSEQEFLARTEGSALRRLSYEQWQRNLAVALGNGPPDAAAMAALSGRREGATALVREHIDWALAQLSSRMKC